MRDFRHSKDFTPLIPSYPAGFNTLLTELIYTCADLVNAPGAKGQRHCKPSWCMSAGGGTCYSTTEQPGKLGIEAEEAEKNNYTGNTASEKGGRNQRLCHLAGFFNPDNNMRHAE